jgi:Secretion system C-terminal sorting domain
VITVSATTANRGIAFCGDVQYSSAVVFTASSAAQSISGSGIFKKAVLDTDPTQANNVVNALMVFHTNGSGGLTLNMPLSAIALQLGGGIVNTSSGSPLTIGYGPTSVTSGTLTTGSNSVTAVVLPLTVAWSGGWVNGPLWRWFTSTTSGQQAALPVGSTSVPQIASVAFTVAPTAGVLSATFNASAPAGGTVIASPLTQGALSITTVSPSGSWLIEPAATNGLTPNTYTTDLYANGFTKADGSSAITLLAETVMLKRPSASTDNADYVLNGVHTASALAGAGIIRLQRSTMSGFSLFAVGGTTAALPLELNSFTGKTMPKTNMLSWETAQERDVNAHIVERSADGATWIEIGRKAGQVSSNVSTKYELEDRAPLAKAYYRLRSVDFDGKESISAAIVLTRKSELFAITNVFPNPTDARVTVQFATKNEAPVTIRIVDLTGRLVLEQQTEAAAGINEIPVNMQTLATGVYNVTITNGTETAGPVRIIKGE